MKFENIASNGRVEHALTYGGREDVLITASTVAAREPLFLALDFDLWAVKRQVAYCISVQMGGMEEDPRATT
jgi:hypothetical protein